MQATYPRDGENLLSSETRPLLSIIIPVHNEEHRMPPSLEKIDSFLSTQHYDYEVVIVENGSADRTFEVAQEFSKTYSYIRAIQVDTRGKGLAVKAGMLAARGEYRFICDVDLSMPIEEILKFLPPQAGDAEIIIASREGEGANRIGEPEYRHIMGRVLNFIIKLAAVRGFEDTQCGFKMFTRDVAEDLFRVQQMSGIGFDVELLFIAKRRGYSVKEVPITWYFDADSRMKLVQDSLHILVEIWQIRKNWRKGVYAKEEEKA